MDEDAEQLNVTLGILVALGAETGPMTRRTVQAALCAAWELAQEAGPDGENPFEVEPEKTEQG